MNNVYQSHENDYGNVLPKISIIIVNWNGKKFIRQCLSSVFSSNYPKSKLEVIVVDNASTDGSDKIILNEFPGIILIKNAKNLGYCEANNIGIRSSTGDIIFLLNNDTFIDPDCLIEIVKTMNSSQIGIVGCKLVYMNTSIIQSCGCREIFPGYWEDIAGGLSSAEFTYKDPFEVDYVYGAALAVRREVLKKIGLLDPVYWAYVEDVDLCYRARKSGFKVVTAPKAVVYHYGSASWTGRLFKQYLLMYRNKALFIYKNRQNLTYLLEYIFWYIPSFMLRSLRNLILQRTVTQRIYQKISKKNHNYFIQIAMLFILNTFFFIVGLTTALYVLSRIGMK